ncbi:MAG: hypothetical protein KF875_05890 [Trueperaceae bacterium]|nr:hypothetical protein [Trueperaceae bacterium]MCO5174581.1 hypothetical protein [Trueperaceae bacterium]
MTRIGNVMRLQLVNRQAYVVLPLIVLGGAVLIAFLVFLLVPYGGPKHAIGATAAPLWAFVVVGIQALTLSFPFSQALGVTRRDFHLGTVMTAALTSGMLALIYLAIALLEKATGGWGMSGFFALPGLDGDAPLAALASYFTLAMLCFLSGYWCAAIFKRWGTVVLLTVLVGVSLAVVAAALLVIRFGAWDAVVGWLVSQGVLGMSAWGLVLAAALTASSYVTLRRVTQ